MQGYINLNLDANQNIKVNIPQSGWSETSPYTQQITINNITEDDFPLGMLDQSEILAEDYINTLANFSRITRITTSNGLITCYAETELPELNIPLLLKKFPREDS